MRPILIQSLPCPDQCSRSIRGWSAFAVAMVFLFGPCFAQASTYYLSPYGSDSNSGASTSAAWLSPNHSLNCGDVIVATASTSYSASNFYTRKWGTVNCPAGNNVAWLKCATFDACKISTTANQGMWVTGESKDGKLQPARQTPTAHALPLPLLTPLHNKFITLSSPMTLRVDVLRADSRR
jgi:hypothetical protein